MKHQRWSKLGNRGAGPARTDLGSPGLPWRALRTEEIPSPGSRAPIFEAKHACSLNFSESMKLNQLIQFIDFCSRILHRLCLGTLGAILQGTVAGAAVGEGSTELTVAAKRGEARGRSIPLHFLSKVVGKVSLFESHQSHKWRKPEHSCEFRIELVDEPSFQISDRIFEKCSQY